MAPLWCGLGCRSRTLMVEYISPWFFLTQPPAPRHDKARWQCGTPLPGTRPGGTHSRARAEAPAIHLPSESTVRQSLRHPGPSLAHGGPSPPGRCHDWVGPTVPRWDPARRLRLQVCTFPLRTAVQPRGPGLRRRAGSGIRLGDRRMGLRDAPLTHWDTPARRRPGAVRGPFESRCAAGIFRGTPDPELTKRD